MGNNSWYWFWFMMQSWDAGELRGSAFTDLGYKCYITVHVRGWDKIFDNGMVLTRMLEWSGCRNHHCTVMKNVQFQKRITFFKLPCIIGAMTWLKLVNVEPVSLSPSLALSHTHTHRTLENVFCSTETGLSSPQKSDWSQISGSHTLTHSIWV